MESLLWSGTDETMVPYHNIVENIWVFFLSWLVEQFEFKNCDRACENRECGHKLHPITLQVISQYWKRIFPFYNLHHDANEMLTMSGNLQCHSIMVQKVMSDEIVKR